MLNIGRWGLRAPEGTDGPPNVPLWMQRLATDLSDVAKDNQGVAAARPTSTTLTPGISGRYFATTDELDAGVARRRVYRDAGTAWDELATLPVSRRMLAADVVAEFPSGLLTIAQFLALPAQPSGTVVRVQLVVPTATVVGVNVRLRLNGVSPSASKWECEGYTGDGLRADVVTGEATSNAVAWQNLTTVGPELIPGIAGVWDWEIEARAQNNAATIQDALIALSNGGAVPASDAGAVTTLPAASSRFGLLYRSGTITLAANNTAARMQYINGSATAVTYSHRRLRMVPVRVTGPAVA